MAPPCRRAVPPRAAELRRIRRGVRRRSARLRRRGYVLSRRLGRPGGAHLALVAAGAHRRDHDGRRRHRRDHREPGAVQPDPRPAAVGQAAGRDRPGPGRRRLRADPGGRHRHRRRGERPLGAVAHGDPAGQPRRRGRRLRRRHDPPDRSRCPGSPRAGRRCCSALPGRPARRRRRRRPGLAVRARARQHRCPQPTLLIGAAGAHRHRRQPADRAVLRLPAGPGGGEPLADPQHGHHQRGRADAVRRRHRRAGDPAGGRPGAPGRRHRPAAGRGRSSRNA